MQNEILIVENELDILNIFEELFIDEGYKVFTAANGEEGFIEYLNTFPKVIFIDLNLEGINGFELCKKIKSDNPACLCFAITSYSIDYKINKSRESGFDDYFTKPISNNQLLEITKNAFNIINRWENYNTINMEKIFH